MWDIQGSVELPERADAGAVLRQLESDLRLMAHTKVRRDAQSILYEVSARRLLMWMRSGEVPMVDRVDVGKLRVDPDVRRISFQLSMDRFCMWCLSASAALIVAGLAFGWSPITAVAYGIFTFVFSWVGNQWSVERRVTRYLTTIAGMAPYRAPVDLDIRIGK
jgi:hypothetical protein